jgi:uncharacterized protein YfkK (UPF0435 family)
MANADSPIEKLIEQLTALRGLVVELETDFGNDHQSDLERISQLAEEIGTTTKLSAIPEYITDTNSSYNSCTEDLTDLLDLIDRQEELVTGETSAQR